MELKPYISDFHFILKDLNISTIKKVKTMTLSSSFYIIFFFLDNLVIKRYDKDISNYM